MNISRRSFLKVAGLSAVAVAGASMFTGCSNNFLTTPVKYYPAKGVTGLDDIIKKLNDSGITVLVVEQNANKALKIADRGYVLETGNIVISDTAENMRNNDTVQKAYLGG